MRQFLYKVFVIATLVILICCNKSVYGEEKKFNPGTLICEWHFSNSDGVDTSIIVDELKTYLGYEDNHLYNYMNFKTTMTVTKVEKQKYNIKFGKETEKFSIQDDVKSSKIKSTYGIEDPDPDGKADIGTTWTFDVGLYCYCFAIGVDSFGLGSTGALDVDYYLRMMKLGTYEDVDKVKNYKDSKATIENIDLNRGTQEDGVDRLDELPDTFADMGKDIAKSFLPKEVRDFLDHPIESVLNLIICIIRGLGDIFQIFANLAQTSIDGNVSHLWATYTFDELSAQGPEGSANKYTKVSAYKKDDVVEGTTISPQNISQKTEDGEDYGFTTDTRIPVIVVDLYTMAANKVGLLDANFLDPDSMEHGKAWLAVRNIMASLIYAMLYITAACLLVTLIWRGIRIVRSTLDSPEKRKRQIEGLQKFALSVALLIGVLVIEALCIYASNIFLEDIAEGRDSTEFPIRVNVEGAYSFSTTPTGYFRYMSEIENLDLLGIKAAYAVGYLLMAFMNWVIMLAMFVRMLLMMLLAVVGYVIVLINVFSKENSSNWRFKDWVMLYIGIAFIQVFLALVSRIMFKTCF